MTKKKMLIAALGILLIAASAVTLWLLRESRISSSQQPELQQKSKTEQKKDAGRVSGAENSSGKESFNIPVLRFTPTDKETLAYQFEMKSDVAVDFDFVISKVKPDEKKQSAAAPNKSNFILNTSGKLCLKFFTKQSGMWDAAGLLKEVDYKFDNVAPSYADALKFPFTFTITQQGYISDFKSTKGTPPEAESFIKQLLYSFQTALPTDAKNEWNTNEIDVNGKYRAKYQIREKEEKTETFSLNKQKLDYISIISLKEMPDFNIKIKESNSKVTVIPDNAWIVDIHGRESTVSETDNYVWGEGVTTFSAKQIQEDISGEFPETFSEFIALLSSPKYRQSRYYATREDFNKLAQGLDTKGAIDKYSEILKSDISNKKSIAEDFFVNYLRLNPYAAFDVVNIVNGDPKRDNYDQSTHLILWRLLTESGHTEAQRAVIQAATDPKYSNLTQMRAIAYIHDFENPEPFLAEDLWKLHKTLSINSSNQDEAELRDMALYAIGALGNEEKLNDELKLKIGKELAEYLKNVSNKEDTIAALTAIGNYGGSELLDDISPLLSSSEEDVRVAAYSSMRRMKDSSAVELLIKSYYNEDSPKVQKSAVKTLASMAVTEQGIKFAQQEVVKTDNYELQIPLVKIIGENLKTYPENEKVLRNVLNDKTDNMVKKEIYKYIMPK
ncbi:MAG: HEAT repeat domain-containing protein [Desulfamplus sp.]|nr:HEAT repeat domain-containing protein [Desulfamplus sp.]